MFDIKFVEENKDQIIKTLKNRNISSDKVDLDKLFELVALYKKSLAEFEELRHVQKEASKKLSSADKDEKAKMLAELKSVSEKAKKLEAESKESKAKMDKILVWIPNILSEDVHAGKGEEDNMELKVWNSEKGYFKKNEIGDFNASTKLQNRVGVAEKDDGFKPKHHIDIAEKLDLIDVNQSAKVSGSRFSYIKGELAVLQMALFNFLSKELIRRGFVQYIPPLLVKERALFGTSHFPADQDQIYEIQTKGKTQEEEALYLVGSSEPSLFSYFADKTIDSDALPQKMFAITTCFRSEAGSWGKDTKGIKRVHQFDKLEMDVVCEKDQSIKVWEELLEVNEWMLQELKLPYRVLAKCSGDSGYFATHKGYDWDYWLPAQGVYMEGGSLTNTSDYQARRLNIKVKNSKGKNEFAYTLNDTGVTTRALIAILENYQTKDGSIEVPEVLREFCGFDKIVAKK